MSNNAVVPFDFSAPATRGSRRPNSINQDAMITSAGFPVISIKGKTFAIVKDGERKVLTRVIDDEEIPVASLSMAIVRANSKSRVFYAKGYVEGDSDGSKPTCFSHDGVAPDGEAEMPQSNKCQLCQHAQWGTKMSADGAGKGTACTVNTRLAVVDPKTPDTVFLLRVPAGSRTNFSDAVKLADSHGKDYNEVSMRISFDQEAPSPKLVFKPTGILTDEAFAKVQALYEDDTVKAIVGTPSMATAQEVARPALAAPTPRAAPAPAIAAAPTITEDDIEMALSAVAAPAAAPKPAARKPVAKAVAAPVAAPAAKAPASDVGGLLGDLESLLSDSDD